jgi:hypothetical protein
MSAESRLSCALGRRQPLEIKGRDDAIEFTPEPSSCEVNLTEVGTDPDVAAERFGENGQRSGIVAARNYAKFKRFVTL